MKLLGIDTGGTFTDFVYYDGRRLRLHKTLSTPRAPEQAVLQGLEEMGLSLEELDIIHGSTVVTNAVLEKKGVRTAYITNRGFADLLTIGRQARQNLYALQPQAVEPPVAAEFCLETGGRLDADGRVLEPLDSAQLEALRCRVEQLAPAAVAINLLFSYVDDRFERRIEEVMPDSVFVSRSSQVLAEMGEYERGIVTWLNAWTGPLAQRYLQRLERQVAPARLTVMQSHGGTMAAGQAGRHAVGMLLSGPAGGLKGAQYIAGLSGRHRLLTLDMGGTSTDVALIDGEVSLTNEGRIGGYPVAVPMVDMHTIGAGGGSIARVDAGGLLQVGPQSAGADPGPACYGKGGRQATVTDANLVLGRLFADRFLGGRMMLDSAAAEAVVDRLAVQLGVSRIECAQGIVRVANEHMSGALRKISVERGIDPRDFTLVSFGGAGGLHVCALAQALEISRILIPRYAGVLSALGMLVSPRSRQLSRTVNRMLAHAEAGEVESVFAALISTGTAELAAEGVDRGRLKVQRLADLRYLGQSYCLTLPWQSPARLADSFHQAHAQRYGHRLHEPVELATLRVSLVAASTPLELEPAGRDGSRSSPDSPAADGLVCHQRDRLCAGDRLVGPALVVEEVATTYVAEGWQGSCDAQGNLVLSTGAV